MSYTPSAQNYVIRLEPRRCPATDERAWLLRLALRPEVAAKLRLAMAREQMKLEEGS